jgi:hypothetical protein
VQIKLHFFKNQERRASTSPLAAFGYSKFGLGQRRSRRHGSQPRQKSKWVLPQDCFTLTWIKAVWLHIRPVLATQDFDVRQRR